MKHINERILKFVELSQDETFDTWTPSQRLYNAIDCALDSFSHDTMTGAKRKIRAYTSAILGGLI